MFPPPKRAPRGAVVAFPAATLPRHPSPATAASDSPRPAASPPARFILPLPKLLAEEYYVPKGMGPRQHQKLFWQIIRSSEGSAYCKAMDRAHKAREELEIAVGEQHRMLFTLMWQQRPHLARRLLAHMHPTTARRIVAGLNGRRA
jgi:hypothetical protein